MSHSTRLIWIVFTITITVYVAFFQFGWISDDSGEGADHCAVTGFGILFILLLGTIIEVFTNRKKRSPRGFEPIMPPTAAPRDDDPPPS
ncbi:MAG TPA: hypothetical protein VIL86_01135 [Tepidisphaeraceae bacterium]|jgi:hypothetical protein